MKKISLVLIGLFLGVLISFGYTYLQSKDIVRGYNLYTFSDMGNKNDPLNYVSSPDSDDYISAAGTWFREDNTLTNIHVSSKIDCFKKEMTCYQADAKNYNGILLSDIELYSINEWN